LNIVHFIDIRIEQCSFSPEATKMQTLAAEIVNTFVDDATALVTGCGQIVVHLLTAPIERLANACDVAGVLAGRRVQDIKMKRARVSNAGTEGSRGRRWPLGNRLFSFRSLRDLT
jgi:hypothetical protein